MEIDSLELPDWGPKNEMSGWQEISRENASVCFSKKHSKKFILIPSFQKFARSFFYDRRPSCMALNLYSNAQMDLNKDRVATFRPANFSG